MIKNKDLYFNDKTCPQCGNVFTLPCVTRWAYKKHSGKTTKYFCSWTCLRNAEIKNGGSKVKDQEKQRVRMSPAEMQKAVEMFRNGDKGLDQFLKDHGITNVYKWRYNVKTRYGIDVPEPATVQVDGPIRIETKEPEKVKVVPTEPEKRVPLQYDGYTVCCIESKTFGRFYWDRDHNHLDWTTAEGEEVSFTPAGWKMFLEELPKVAEILGVEL